MQEMGWIPGSGRSPVGGNGNLLQYPCLENPMEEPDVQSMGLQRQTWLSTKMPHGPCLCRMTTVSSESGVQRQWSPSLGQSRGKRSSFFFLWFLGSRQARNQSNSLSYPPKYYFQSSYTLHKLAWFLANWMCFGHDICEEHNSVVADTIKSNR